MNRYELFIGEDDQYYFNLVAGNHKVVLRSSEGYPKKASALKGIESVRKHASCDDNYQRKDSVDGEYYFVIKANNNETIGVSETYPEKPIRDQGIEAVKRIAPHAKVEDRT